MHERLAYWVGYHASYALRICVAAGKSAARKPSIMPDYLAENLVCFVCVAE